jgi:hypothetical protein
MCATLYLQGIRGNSQDAGRFAEFSVESRAWAVTEQPSASESDWRSLSILSDSIWRDPLRQMQLDRKIVFCIQSGREPITPPWDWVYFQQVSRDGGIGVPDRIRRLCRKARISAGFNAPVSRSVYPMGVSEGKRVSQGQFVWSPS